MDEYEYNGNWQALNATQTPASITRQSGANTITMVVDPDHPDNFPSFKKATIPLSIDLTLSLNSIGTLFFQTIFVSTKNHATDGARGNFTFKDTHKLIEEGLCANWTQDRVVFYESDNVAKDWVGFVRHFL